MNQCFDNIEILQRHIPIVISRLDIIRDAVTSEEFSPPLSNPNWVNVSKFIEMRIAVIKSGKEFVTRVPDDILAFVKTFVTQKMTNVIYDIDYISNWIYNVTSSIKIFEHSIAHLNIRYELPLTLAICNIFVTFTKIISVLHYLILRLSTMWHCMWMIMSNNGSIRLTTPSNFIDEMLTSIISKPLDYVAKHMSSIRIHLESLTSQLSSLMSQVFNVYSIFNWRILSVEDIEQPEIDSTLANTKYFIFQNLHLFYSTVVFFGLVFPQFFAENVSFGSFAISVYSEEKNIHLTNSFSVPLATVLNLASTPLPFKIMDSALRDNEIKFESSHQVRIRILTNLIEDYIERSSNQVDTMALYFEQILAVFGFVYYELLVCYEHQSSKMLDLIASVMNLYQMIDQEEVSIQRTYIYSMMTIDSIYLRDISLKFKKLQLPFERKFMLGINSIAKILTFISVENFDDGVRYDFYPLQVTHGRLLTYSYEDKRELSSVFTLMEHITTICRHASFVESPLGAINYVFPVKDHPFLVTRIGDYISTNESNISSIIPALRIFNMVPVDETLEKSFKRAIDTVLAKIMAIVEETMAVESKNVQIIRQTYMDPEFNVLDFNAPTPKTLEEVYAADTGIIRRLSAAMETVKVIPEQYSFGKVRINVKKELERLFLEWMDQKVLSSSFSPVFTSSFVTMLQQVINPFFTLLGIPFIPTLASKIRKASPLLGDNSLTAQFDMFVGKISRENLPKTSPFISSYLNKLENFINGEHIFSRFERLGGRFVPIPGTNYTFNYENYFALEPIKSILTSFGILAGTRIDAFMLDNLMNSFSFLVNQYETHDDSISAMNNAYIKSHRLDYDAIRSGFLKASSDKLLTYGLARALRELLGLASKEVLGQVIPGLQTIIHACKERVKQVNNRMLAFTEATNPGEMDWFLMTRSNSTFKKPFDAMKFAFFIAILLANSEWDDMQFDTENDSFSHSLQLIPLAIDGILTILKKRIFTEVKAKLFFSYFFSVLKAIAHAKKERDREQYANFVIFVDHITSMSSIIKYGHMSHYFPFPEIRECYNEIAEKERK